MGVNIPSLEELAQIRDSQKSRELGESVVFGILEETFRELQELLRFENRTLPENRDRVLELFSLGTRAKIQMIDTSWGQGTTLLIGMEDIGNIEEFLDTESYTRSDTENALINLFQDLRTDKISPEDAINKLKETVRRSKGLISPQGTSSGRMWGFLSMMGSIFPEVVNGAMGVNAYTNTVQE